MGSGRKLIRVTLFLIVLSLLLQLISFASPGWMIITFYQNSDSSLVDKVEILVALWYTRTCVTGSIIKYCITWFYHDMAKITTGGRLQIEDWLEYEVETTLALVACIVSLVLVAIGFKNKTCTKSYTAMASGLMLFSGIIAWIPVGKISTYIKEVYDLNRATPFNQMSMGAPWALILAAIAAFISNVCAIFLLILACKQNEQTSGIIYPNAGDENGTVSNIPMQQMQVSNNGSHVYPTAPPPYIQAPMIMHTYGYNMYHSLAHPSASFGPIYPQYTPNYQISPPPQYTEKLN